MKKKSKKEITLDDLASKMEKGFENGRKEIDDLALMVAKGFDDMENRFGERFDRLEKGQKEIKTDLAYRVHVFDHKELEFRVERLEEKTGISRRKYKSGL